jgi:hypothetical protein
MFTLALSSSFRNSILSWLGASTAAQQCANILVPQAFNALLLVNTRAVPLVRQENAHQGRVFLCPDFRISASAQLDRVTLPAYSELLSQQPLTNYN